MSSWYFSSLPYRIWTIVHNEKKIKRNRFARLFLFCSFNYSNYKLQKRAARNFPKRQQRVRKNATTGTQKRLWGFSLFFEHHNIGIIDRISSTLGKGRTQSWVHFEISFFIRNCPTTFTGSSVTLLKLPQLLNPPFQQIRTTYFPRPRHGQRPVPPPPSWPPP